MEMLVLNDGFYFREQTENKCCTWSIVVGVNLENYSLITFLSMVTRGNSQKSGCFPADNYFGCSTAEFEET